MKVSLFCFQLRGPARGVPPRSPPEELVDSEGVLLVRLWHAHRGEHHQGHKVGGSVGTEVREWCISDNDKKTG